MKGFKFSFKTKLYLVLSLLVGISLLSVTLTLERIITDRIEDNFSKEFRNTVAAFRHTQELQNRFVSDEIASLSKNNPQFRTILSTASLQFDDLGFGGSDESDTDLQDANLRLNSILPSLVINQKSDIFIVTNSLGQLLYSKVSPTTYGLELSTLGILVDAYQSPRAMDIWLSEDEIKHKSVLIPMLQDSLYQVIAKPVVFGNEIHGFVIVGSQVKEDILRQLKAISGVELILYGLSSLYNSTLPNEETEAFTEVFKTSAIATENEPKQILLSEQPFLYLPSPLLENIRVGRAGFAILKPLASEFQFLAKIELTLLIVGLIALLLALFMGYFVARGVSKPVHVLGDAAKRIGQGDLKQKVNIKTGDELEDLGEAFNSMTEGLKEREFLKDTFERYVSKEIATEILKNPSLVKLGGMEKEISVFFADIGGFTTLSEQLPADAVVRYLNEYFETMCQHIIHFNGTLSQFQGDALVAFWGAPIAQKNHSELACRAALLCADALEKLAEEWQGKGLPITHFRIGITTGNAIVGNVGSSTRFEYTAIGDNVNLASRLEGANKFYGTRILMSENTWYQSKHTVVAREIDTIYVIGKSEPVRVFEPLAIKGEDSLKAEQLEKFHQEALKYYRMQDWDSAKEIFEQLLTMKPNDAPAKIFLKRMTQFEQNPPGDDWDGAFILQKK